MNESFWKGAFIKTVDDVGFVLLPEMTQNDWDFLDFFRLRPTAKNRIVEAMVAGELVGFYDVRVTNKVRGPAKPRYLWPVLRNALAEAGAHQFFRNEGNEEASEQTDNTDDVEDIVDRGRRLRRIERLVALVLAGIAIEEIREDFSEWETKDEIEKYLETLNLPYRLLVLIILWLRTHTIQELLDLLDQLEEEEFAA